MTNENQKWDREILENDDAALRSALSELQMMGSVEALNRPGFDAAIFCEKDSDYAQAVPARSS